MIKTIKWTRSDLTLPTKQTNEMSKPNTLKIDDVEYIRADKVPTNSPPIGEKRIIAADRGWVFVGDCVDNDDGSVTIYNAKNIRRWGTTKGLGELVKGPMSSTEYDPYGTVKVNPIVTIAVTGGGW